MWRTFGTPQTCGGRLTGDSTDALVGEVVGRRLGDSMGALVGEVVGRLLGDWTGALVGEAVGRRLGDSTGALVGDVVGRLLGESTGAVVGEAVGRLLGGSTTYCKVKITVEEATFSPPITSVALTSVGVLLITNSEQGFNLPAMSPQKAYGGFNSVRKIGIEFQPN